MKPCILLLVLGACTGKEDHDVVVIDTPSVDTPSVDTPEVPPDTPVEPHDTKVDSAGPVYLPPPPIVRPAANLVKVGYAFSCAAHETRGLWCWGAGPDGWEYMPGTGPVPWLDGVPTGTLVADLDINYGGTAVTPEGRRLYWPTMLTSYDRFPAEHVKQLTAHGCFINAWDEGWCGPGHSGPELDVKRYHSYAFRLTLCRQWPNDTVTCEGQFTPGDVWASRIPWPPANAVWRSYDVDKHAAIGVLATGEIHYASGYGGDYFRQWDPNTPVVSREAPPGNQWVDAKTGEHEACAMDNTGELTCWSFYNVLENTSIADEPQGPFIAFDVSFGTACAMRPGGEVVCWGDSRFGEGTPTQMP